MSNYSQGHLEELQNFLSSKTIGKLSGVPKKCFRYALAAIFYNIAAGKHSSQDQKTNLNWARTIIESPKTFRNEEILERFQSNVETSLRRGNYKNYDSTNTIDKIIEIFREMVNQIINKGEYLVLVNKLEKIIDLKKHFNRTNPNLQSHHWIHISLEKGMIPTIPEFFIYSDIINSWNMLIDKLTSREDLLRKVKIDALTIRQLKYEAEALSRNLWILSITFAESYLYYLFYNIKVGKFPLHNEEAIKTSQLKKVEDKQILNNLVKPEFIQNCDEDIKQRFEDLCKSYNEINTIRNRIIHPSAFEESNNSHLLPLLNMTIDELVAALETVVELITHIDETLPEQLKLLYWWDTVQHPDYQTYKKGNMVNPNISTPF